MSDIPRFELRRRSDGNLLVGVLCPQGSDHIVWRPPPGLTPVDYPDPDVYQWRRIDEDGESEPHVHHMYMDGFGWTSTVGMRDGPNDA